MEITTYQKYGFRIVNICERIGIATNSTPLKNALEDVVEEGRYHVAVIVPPGSFLSSSTISCMVHCAKAVNLHGGSFAVVSRSPQLLELCHVFDLDMVMHLVPHEDILARAEVHEPV